VLGDVTGPRDRRDRRHGDGEVRLPLARREHPEPGDFLAHANEVVVERDRRGRSSSRCSTSRRRRPGESVARAPGIRRRGWCANGGAAPLGLRGLALGIAERPEYEAERVQLEPGDAAGAVHRTACSRARRDGELYGEERLDASLARHASLPAEHWPWRSSRTAGLRRRARATICAVVVLKRT
jgi:hypothetical protein